jgi:LmbE family N-acetylglucosaminyl deacetylase
VRFVKQNSGTPRTRSASLTSSSCGTQIAKCVYPLACSHLAFPELLSEHEPHRAGEVYVIQTDQPTLVVDISTTIDLKVEAFMCHASQIGDMTAVALSMRERAAGLGRPYGLPFAECFDRVTVPAEAAST